MTAPKTLPVRIRLGPVGVGAEIEIAGTRVESYVTALSFESSVDGLTTLNLQFIKVDLDVEGPVDLSAMGDWYKTYRMAQAIRDGLAAVTAEGATT